MGRFGKLPVKLPENVKVDIDGHLVTVAGPRGALTRSFPKVDIVVADGSLSVGQKGTSKASRAACGSARAHLVNMVRGVSEGWQKQLEISGPGYRAEVRGGDLVLMVGYSHPVTIKAPENISFSVEKNIITVSGISRDEVGHISALIRDSRRPNPYTGSGIRYVDENVRRKVGRQAGKTE